MAGGLLVLVLHRYVKHYYPREPPAPPEPFDWSFDGFKPTAKAVQAKLYEECLQK